MQNENAPPNDDVLPDHIIENGEVTQPPNHDQVFNQMCGRVLRPHQQAQVDAVLAGDLKLSEIPPNTGKARGITETKHREDGVNISKVAGDVVDAHEQEQFEKAKNAIFTDLGADTLEVRTKYIPNPKIVGNKKRIYEILGVTIPPAPEPEWFHAKKPTENLMRFLARHGFGMEDFDDMSYWTARCLLDAIQDRHDKGLCTIRQALMLAKHGENPNSTFEEAKVKIDGIFADRGKFLEIAQSAINEAVQKSLAGPGVLTQPSPLNEADLLNVVLDGDFGYKPLTLPEGYEPCKVTLDLSRQNRHPDAETPLTPLPEGYENILARYKSIDGREEGEIITECEIKKGDFIRVFRRRIGSDRVGFVRARIAIEDGKIPPLT